MEKISAQEIYAEYHVSDSNQFFYRVSEVDAEIANYIKKIAEKSIEIIDLVDERQKFNASVARLVEVYREYAGANSKCSCRLCKAVTGVVAQMKEVE